MKFTCPKDDLVQALQIVDKAVSPKPQNPILSGIYIKAENNTLELQSTDYEIGIIAKLEAQVEVPGITVLAGKYSQEVIRRLPGDTVEFEFDNSAKLVRIKSQRSNFSFLCMEAADFPTITKVQGDVNFDISDRVLRDMILNTTFSCAHDESRPVFTGCLMEINNQAINMVATDTHRLSVKSGVLEDYEGNRKLIIPGKLLVDLQKTLLSDLPRTVHISCNSNHISFEFDNVYISSRLIDGQFPDYTRVIPADFKTRITMNTEEIRKIVDRIALISRTNDYNVINMEFSNGMVKISSQNPEIGNGEEFAAATIDGDDIRISCNADYLNDGLKNIKAKDFHMYINTPMTPVSIRQDEDPDFIYVVTPVRS